MPLGTEVYKRYTVRYTCICSDMLGVGHESAA